MYRTIMSTQSDEIAPSLSRPAANNNNAGKNQKVNNTSNNDDDDHDTSFLDLHDHIRVTILNYLGETQDELMTLTLVSKQVHEDCKQPGIEWKIIPTIQIRPRQQQGGSPLALLQQLHHHQNKMDNVNIQRYHHMKVNDVHKFTDIKNMNKSLRDIRKDLQMNSILSLDMSLSMPMDVRWFFADIFVYILPNLREINLSNICTFNTTLQRFSHRCPHLEKVTWNNITNDTYIRLSGIDLNSKAKNLK